MENALGFNSQGSLCSFKKTNYICAAKGFSTDGTVLNYLAQYERFPYDTIQLQPA